MSETNAYHVSDNAAEMYQANMVRYMFMPWGERMLSLAAVQPGEHVLDVACGTGVVTRLAAIAAGRSGAVTGVDVNPAMLAVAGAIEPVDGAPITWIEADAIEDLIGVRLRVPTPGDEIRAPGMLQSHYAPNLPLRLNATTVAAGEALLAFGPKPPTGAATVLNLSERGNLQQAAAQLFAMLHELDRPDYDGIAVMPVPNDGLGVAINDRLRRAAGL